MNTRDAVTGLVGIAVIVAIGVVVAFVSLDDGDSEPVPASPPAASAPPQRADLAWLHDALNGHDFAQQDGARVIVSGVVYKVLADTPCSSLMLRPPGQPLKPVRCDIACPFTAERFQIGEIATVTATVKAGPLGAILVGCKPADTVASAGGS